MIAPARIGDWPAAATPIRVHVTLRGGYLPGPGEPISLLAVINAPPTPASPGSYDFARDSFFQSVGGVGFALGPAQTWAAPVAAPWRLRMTMRINALRWELTRRIVDTLGVRTGGLAAAMTTGHDAFIPNALGAVVAYLVLSGAPPPAERSAVTAAVAFGAMLVDRQAISLHALALAAMGILLLQPEAVTQPGFQMSFAATAALVALAEVWPHPVTEINTPWPIPIVHGLWTWTLAGAAASFVAGLATGPFAMQDFNRVSTWGLISNMVTEPISGFLMMPGLALGAVLTPFGLGEWPLQVAGFAIGLMNNVAHIAATAPYAQINVASGPAWSLPASFLGLLWLCLWKGRLRWLGLPLALAVNLAPKPTTPDAWASADGSAIAVRAAKTAVLFRPDGGRLERQAAPEGGTSGRALQLGRGGDPAQRLRTGGLPRAGGAHRP